jgi:hypothetical protein
MYGVPPTQDPHVLRMVYHYDLSWDARLSGLPVEHRLRVRLAKGHPDAA